ncbi:hypothetical protein MCOR25_006930 [Pyricularia grisea]|uniref:Uncharacterized protein n=1 Tax=Pyricularia grisea TaxID=148305 RepID=A0A6P8BB15_PYRGI|nr:uncharacterized protein PgNI_04629 [Pyricularia grisea]KAI6359887.1 hypothetical protein MCOR25_006930 [Pyricularia grisea]TLD12892.1 hypothetical protein PgNI_04629 [Pyricularia grisea]
MESDDDSGTLGSLNKYLRMIKGRDSPHSAVDDGTSPQSRTSTNLSSASKPTSTKDCQLPTRSHRSSISSTVSSTITDLSDGRPGLRGRNSAIASSSSFSSSTSLESNRTTSLTERQRDPLLREFPKPPEQVDIEEMLTRPPGKWSLGHYFNKSRHAAKETTLKPTVEDRKGELEEAKKQLIAARNEIRHLGTRRP